MCVYYLSRENQPLPPSSLPSRPTPPHMSPLCPLFCPVFGAEISSIEVVRSEVWLPLSYKRLQFGRTDQFVLGYPDLMMRIVAGQSCQSYSVSVRASLLLSALCCSCVGPAGSGEDRGARGAGGAGGCWTRLPCAGPGSSDPVQLPRPGGGGLLCGPSDSVPGLPRVSGPGNSGADQAQLPLSQR